MRLGSFFSGVGGFELAFDGVAETVFTSEFDKNASAVLAHRFPDVPNLGDIIKISEETVRDHAPDIIVGGFPCQDLSVAGKRAGLEGARSGLFFEMVRLIAAARPRWLVLENVPGLLSSNDGRDMGAVLGALDELGYGWAYRVLDAQFFGVPQRRRRVFIVAHLGHATRAGAVLLEREGVPGNPPARGEARAEAAPASDDGSRLDCPTRDVVSTLQAGGGERGYRIDAEAAGGGHLIPVFGQPARTLTHHAGRYDADSENFLVDPSGLRVRRLTPLECERLQGFPDDWTLVPARQLKSGEWRMATDSARYKQMGNAVAVPVVRWIAQRIAAVERGEMAA